MANRVRRACSEEVEVFRKPNCEYLEGSRSWRVGGRFESPAYDHQSHVLQILPLNRLLYQHAILWWI